MATPPALPLHLQTAQEVVELLRTKSVTPLELIAVVEARLTATDCFLKSTPVTCFERAKEAARGQVHPPNPPPGMLRVCVVRVCECQGALRALNTPPSPTVLPPPPPSPPPPPPPCRLPVRVADSNQRSSRCGRRAVDRGVSTPCQPNPRRFRPNRPPTRGDGWDCSRENEHTRVPCRITLIQPREPNHSLTLRHTHLCGGVVWGVCRCLGRCTDLVGNRV
jgi:hypothetical protein